MSDFRVGDRVEIAEHRSVHGIFATVKRVTPTGQVTVTTAGGGERRFTADGNEIGRRWDGATLHHAPDPSPREAEAVEADARAAALEEEAREMRATAEAALKEAQLAHRIALQAAAAKGSLASVERDAAREYRRTPPVRA